MMLLQQATRPEVSAGIAEVVTAEALSALHRPDCPALNWQRQLSPRLRHWLDTLEPEQLPRARVILRPEVVPEAASQICEESNTPDCEQRTMLIEDTTELAKAFAGLMRTPFLRLRYDVVSTNACRKFHIDTVTARLICTYRGPGTQYGFGGDGETGPLRVFNAATGAPILLRGRLWPERPDAGLRHRSPPIEGTGQTRLVLVLDPISDPDAHSEQTFIS